MAPQGGCREQRRGGLDQRDDLPLIEATPPLLTTPTLRRIRPLCLGQAGSSGQPPGWVYSQMDLDLLAFFRFRQSEWVSVTIRSWGKGEDSNPRALRENALTRPLGCPISSYF